MGYDRGGSFIQLLSGKLESGQSLPNRFSSDSGSLSRKYFPVTHARQNLVLIYSHLLRNLRQLVGGCDAHLVADHLCSNIQRTPEDSRKSKRIVDLVGKIRPSCRNNFRTGLFSLPRPNFRNSISASENNR